ncbi:FKBP-type peptidyl-prolyl cis-trans isomerase [Nocardia sp. NBC_00511]|uniref:FKBP-type peptidyl-prolyl cis-trans isomerase n=1 Tax=Nocardia sp. NBC_00511 TaxID=2903591 RepID=UPI0030DFD3C2
MRLMGKIGAIGAAAAAVVLVAGCGSSDSKSDSTSSTAAPFTATVAVPQADGHDCAVTIDGGFGTAPKITIPDGCTPPTDLIVKDIVPGSGPGAAAGQPLTMNYSLVTWSDKKKLDSSFDRGKPFTLTLGAGQVIKGWDQGLVGVQKGARRVLIVPSNLGYGQGGNGIKPNETLVFVTDAVQVGS